ncbi:MAG: LysR family transcriptional regulator [Marinibacterium sp.]|nr:LysR family transcriptional regulator [Marinibacterium sp.]
MNKALDDKSKAAVEALARHGSFRDAAEALGTSPASFSRHISQAEDYVGQPLFERRRNGARLTASGRAFVDLLNRLTEATNLFETSVANLRGGGEQVLSIGCGPLTTRTVISPVLADMLDENPDLRTRIDVSATKKPLEDLRNGIIDVVVCDLTHTPDLSDLEIVLLRKEPVSFWARPGHPIHDKNPATLYDVFSSCFASGYMNRYWQSAAGTILGGNRAAREAADRLPQIECDDFTLLVDLASRSDVVCGGRVDAFAEYEAMGRLKEVRTERELFWNICAARRKGTHSAPLDVFWRRVVANFGTDQGAVA